MSRPAKPELSPRSGSSTLRSRLERKMVAPRGDHPARAEEKVPPSGWPEESAGGASICPQEIAKRAGPSRLPVPGSDHRGLKRASEAVDVSTAAPLKAVARPLYSTPGGRRGKKNAPQQEKAF